MLRFIKVLAQKISSSFAYKLVCADDKFWKPIVLYRSENATYKFIEAILKAYDTVKRSWRNISTKIWS